MGWSVYTHASVDSRKPRAFGVCDRCGFVYNHDRLQWQYQWIGPKLQNLRILVCQTCLDAPQEQLRTLLIPADPMPIPNPRPGEFGSMVISSSPNQYATIVPSEISVNSTSDDDLQLDREPIVTETTSKPLLTEIGVTPYPNPGTGDGNGYTVGGSSQSAT